MAQEVGKEAEEHAESEAAEAASCLQELESGSHDPETKAQLIKQCKQKVKKKKQAYDEAAQAEAASDKAVASAGTNEGEIRGEASLYEDGTSRLLAAKGKAEAAAMKLKTFEQQSALDDKIDKQFLQQEQAADSKVDAARTKAEQAQDHYDNAEARSEQRDPPKSNDESELRPVAPVSTMQTTSDK